jgi:hypothetical protein
MAPPPQLQRAYRVLHRCNNVRAGKCFRFLETFLEELGSSKLDGARITLLLLGCLEITQ